MNALVGLGLPWAIALWRALLLVMSAGSVFAASALPEPAPSHVVVVVMENHAASQILETPNAPYINALAKQGAVFSRSFGVAHPSEPNYLALFSGSTHGVLNDACPLRLAGPNLGRQLIAAKLSFVGYSEGLPIAGFTGCSAPGGYVRKHAPWANFADLPPAIHQPFAAFPFGALDQLPTVSFVVPGLQHDMHDGTVEQGDAWLRAHLDGYVQWSKTHNGLLILTWDEDDTRTGNRVATMFVGPMVRPGVYRQRITHYDVLRTIEALFGLAPANEAAAGTTISGIWSSRPPISR